MGRLPLIPQACALFVCPKDRDNLPIVLPFPIRNLTQREFDEVDAVVMRCAYASQNALGRLCEERVYENDLAARLRTVGLPEIHTQVPEEALTYFCGRESACVRRVPVTRDGLQLGTHQVRMHSDGVIFVVTAFGDSPAQRAHLQRLLRLTGQRAIQWINLNKREVSLTTLLAEER